MVGTSINEPAEKRPIFIKPKWECLILM